MLDDLGDETEHPHHMHMVGEGCLDDAILRVFALKLIHKLQDHLGTLVRVGVDIVLERGALRLIKQQFQLVAMVINEQHILLHMVTHHPIALTCGIAEEVDLILHIVMFTHHALQLSREWRYDMAKQLVLTLEIVIDITVLR